VRRPRWIPPGNLPRGRGINPAELAKRSTKRTPKPATRLVEDGFGTARCYRCEEEVDRGAR
jgi:hypothetical protein